MRDIAIGLQIKLIENKMKDERSRHIAEAFAGFTEEHVDLLRRLIADTVDKTLLLTMALFDRSSFDVTVYAIDGTPTIVKSDYDSLRLELPE